MKSPLFYATYHFASFLLYCVSQFMLIFLSIVSDLLTQRTWFGRLFIYYASLLVMILDFLSFWLWHFSWNASNNKIFSVISDFGNIPFRRLAKWNFCLFRNIRYSFVVIRFFVISVRSFHILHEIAKLPKHYVEWFFQFFLGGMLNQ